MASPQLLQELDVLGAWGLETASVEPLVGGTANENFLVAHRGIRYFLRCRSPRYTDADQIAFDHALMRHLGTAGVRGPNPIPTPAGDTCVRLDDRVYELHLYHDGRPPVWESFYDLSQAAIALRRFHEATATFCPPAPKTWPRDDAPERIRRGLAELNEHVCDPAQRLVLATLEEWTEYVELELSDSAYWALPCQVIHGDFHPGNVTIGEGGVAIFDLDCASYQPRARDLADAILYFCARRDGPFDASTIVRLTRECHLEPERNAAFLDAYGSIGEDELAALPWLVAARWIYSRVHGRHKLASELWPAYATEGVLTPLDDIRENDWEVLPSG